MVRCSPALAVPPPPAEAASPPPGAGGAGGGAAPPSPGGAGLFANASREQLVKMLTESARKLKSFNANATSARPPAPAARPAPRCAAPLPRGLRRGGAALLCADELTRAAPPQSWPRA